MRNVLVVGAVVCSWNLALLSACGDDSTAPAPDPEVPQEFEFVRAGYFRTCGLTTDGAAYCWGIQELNVDEDSIIYVEPTAVEGTAGIQFVGLDLGVNFACGVTSAGAALCWGGRYSNSDGALGRGTTDTSAHYLPAPAVGGRVFESVSTGLNHACGVTTGGSAYCWGSNELGKLGDGTTTARSAPVVVSGGHTFRLVSAGAHNACALTADDDAYCWGSGTQLGDGTTTFDPGSSTPVAVSGGHKFAVVSVGEMATCGVTTDGAAYCWGTYGDIGGGAQTTSYTPARVAGSLALAAISVSLFHICGVTTAGAAYCWGTNDNGQLGNGTTTGSVTPVRVSGGLSFASVSAGLFHTCGVTTEPLAYCWGSGYVGVLGDGAMTDRAAPVRVSGQ